jgi:membrane protease YdiL (CAAX protease family)
MPASSATPLKISAATWVGLFVALFGMLIVRWAVGLFYPELSFTAVLWKEGLIWLCLIVLVVVIRRGERLPLRSIGLGTAPVKSSLLWGGILTVVCAVVAGVTDAFTHFNGGPMEQAFSKLPLWLITVVVVRAGVVEELFYRGYAIERLQSLGLNRYWAGGIPLLIFGFAHATNGWANAIVAFTLGAILTIVYLWRRDLIANMICHFTIDFLSNVLPRLLSHG